MSIADENANLVLADIERAEREILALYKGHVSTPGPVGWREKDGCGSESRDCVKIAFVAAKGAQEALQPAIVGANGERRDDVPALQEIFEAKIVCGRIASGKRI